MSAFAHHLGYEFKGELRDKSQLFMNYVFPLLFFFLVASFMTRIDPSFKARIIPAMSVFALMCSFLLSMPTGLVAARESGLLRSYRINGVPTWTSLAAPALANIGHMAIATALIAVLAAPLFGAPLPASGALFALTWLAMAAATAGLGALLGTLASSTRAATLLAQIIYIPSIILGGLMTPPGIFPPALERLSRVFPATHAMRAFTSGEGLSEGALVSIAAMALGAILSFALAGWLFEWDGKNSRPASRKLLALLAFAPYIATMFLA
jgi:ABC-2 type transport system permease protein